VEGLYGKGFVLLFRASGTSLRPLEEPKEYRDEEGKVKGYYLLLYSPTSRRF